MFVFILQFSVSFKILQGTLGTSTTLAVLRYFSIEEQAIIMANCGICFVMISEITFKMKNPVLMLVEYAKVC